MTTTERKERLDQRSDLDEAVKNLQSIQELLGQFASEPITLVRHTGDKWTTSDEATKKVYQSKR